MQIALNDGREIRLVRLRQWYTYAGVLAGFPTRSRNAERTQKIVASAKPDCLEGLAPYLIPPAITPIEYKPPGELFLRKTGMTARQYAADWENNNYESLPSVACVGEFESGELKRPDSDIWSSMVLVWFQDDFALPIDSNVLAHIQELDWESCAKDWSW